MRWRFSEKTADCFCDDVSDVRCFNRVVYKTESAGEQNRAPADVGGANPASASSLIAMRMQGDSMYPLIADAEVVVFDMAATAAVGAAALIELAPAGIKVLGLYFPDFCGGVRIRPANAIYDDLRVRESDVSSVIPAVYKIVPLGGDYSLAALDQ